VSDGDHLRLLAATVLAFLLAAALLERLDLVLRHRQAVESRP